MIVWTPLPAEKATPTDESVVRSAQIAPAVVRLPFRIADLFAARDRS
jgi:hypothetical protein